MKKILISNVHYFYYHIESFFRNLADLGLNAVELYLGTPHIFIDGRVTDDFANIGALAERYHLHIKAVHPETLSFRYSLCYLDDTWNSLSLSAYKKCIDFAEKIGAESLHTNLVCGFKDFNRNKIMDRCIDNLKVLADYGHKRGVELAIETEAETYQGFIATLQDMKQLLQCEALQALRVGVNMDAIAEAGETLQQWQNTFGKRISYVRVSEPSQLTLQKTFLGDTIVFNSEDRWLEEPYAFDCEVMSCLEEARDCYGAD